MKRIIAVLAACLSVASFAFADTVINEKFTVNPFQNGWQIFGDTNLFVWDPVLQHLQVRWDSTQPDSYFYHPLGATFTETSSFYVQFDLTLSNARATNSGAELAVGLLNFSEATNPVYSRAFFTLPDIFEFDYFPAYIYQGTPYPASVDATMADAAGNGYFCYDSIELNPGVTYRVVLMHPAGESIISGEIFTNGQLVTSLPIVYSGGPGHFQIDTLSINNYSDDGFGDSIFADGVVQNLAFASPLPVGIMHTFEAGKIQFASSTNWLYTLEQSTNLQDWTAAAPPVFGNGTNLILQATNAPADQAFYRVRADLP